MNSLFQKTYLALTILYVAFLVAPPVYSNTVLILLFVLSMADILKSETYQLKGNVRYWPVLFFFVAHVVGLAYSENLKEGLNYVFRISPFLAMPLIFTRISKINSEYLSSIALAFIVSVGISGLLFILSDDKENHYFHPSYLGMYINTAIILLYFKSMDSAKGKIASLVAIVFFSSVVLWSGSRMQVIINILINFSGIIFHLKQSAYRPLKLVAIVSVLTLASVVIGLTENELKRKTVKIIIERTDYIRERNWGINIELLKRHWLVGVGTGDATEELNKLRDPNWLEYMENYNSHNQYLETMVKLGAGGLVTLLLCLFVPALEAIRKQKYPLILFIFFIAASFLTESVLQRHKGICLFIFFYFFFDLNVFSSNRKPISGNIEPII